jgi:glutamyl-tRNA(Gln) amidotransferase subunit E
MPEQVVNPETFEKIRKLVGSKDEDAQLVFWGPAEDIQTAIETIEERCLMAFQGVPNETRKSFENGTTIFERVLPGADRMYPDTDSPPIPLKDDYIDNLKKNLPEDVIDRYHKLKNWGVPEDTYTYIFKKDLFPLIERIVNELDVPPAFCGTFFGHTLKFVEGHFKPSSSFNHKIIFALFRFLKERNLAYELARKMMPVIYQYPKMEFESVLTSIKFKPTEKESIIDRIPFLKKKFSQIRNTGKPEDEHNWIMGQLRPVALGNISLSELSKHLN